MGRPSGTVQKPNALNTALARLAATAARGVITERISEQTGLSVSEADSPSAHLRWALQQMKLRGWENTDWGQLLNTDGSLGDGPICILESVKSPFDSPYQLTQESTEQKYIRLAIKDIGVDPIPAYVSIWNDEQAEFDAVETVMLRAIDLAVTDEQVTNRFHGLNQAELMDLFGLTKDAIYAASISLDVDTSPEAGKHPAPATPADVGGDVSAGPTQGVSDLPSSSVTPTDIE